jgi:hypothetical protein
MTHPRGLAYHPAVHRPIDRGIGGLVLGLTRFASPMLCWSGLERAPRPLDPHERTLAGRALGEALDLDRVRVVRACSLDTWVPGEGHVARTIGDVVFIPGLDGAFSSRALVHELCHVAQFQRGGVAYIGDSVRAQLGAQLARQGRFAAYDWRARLEAGATWAELGAEQQAQLVEDCHAADLVDARAQQALAEARAGRGWFGCRCR